MSTLASVVLRDVIANLPAASIPGRIFYATDTLVIMRDNGTTWDNVTPAASAPSGTANQVYATPDGSSGAASLRALVPADVPTLNQSTTGNAATATTATSATTATTASNATAVGGITVTGTPTTGQVLTATSATAADWQTGGGGSGTVTSVAVSVPSRQTVTGSPVTTSGTIAIADNTQTANEVFAGPSSGAAAAPTFRALAPADLPIATTSAFGAVKPDGTTITVSAGVISAVGGGGSSTKIANLNTSLEAAASSSAFAFKGLLAQPQQNMNVSALWLYVTPTAAQTYSASISTVSAISGTSGVTLTSTPTIAPNVTIPTLPTFVNGGFIWIRVPFTSPVALTAGVNYALLGGITSGTGTTAMLISIPSLLGAAQTSDSIPLYFGVIARVAANPPVNGSTIDTDGGIAAGVHMGIEWS